MIAQDVAAVLSYFPTVPGSLANACRDLTAAVLHRDPLALSTALDEVTELADALAADFAAAAPAFDKLKADAKQLLADLNS
jgi:hypothetical protein